MRPHQLHWHGRFVHALAGGIGSIFAISICYPWECARTRLQVDTDGKNKYSPQVIAHVYATEGIRGVYRGWFSLVVSLFITNFVYFYVFHGLKSFSSHDTSLQALIDLACGIVAGIVAVLISNPLWVVNTRLKLQGAHLQSTQYRDLKHPPYRGILDCMQKIVEYEGFRELWSGLQPSLILVLNPAIHLMVYEMLTRSCMETLCTEVLESYLYFLVGGAAKTVATLVTYPLQVTQTRSRAGFNKNGFSLADIFSIDTWTSLYSGLEAKLTQTVLTASLMYMCYEKIKHYVFYILEDGEM